MASKRPLQPLFTLASSSLRTAKCPKTLPVRTSARTYFSSDEFPPAASTSTPPSTPKEPIRGPEYSTEPSATPRWQKTPERMVAPHRIRPTIDSHREFTVNQDPRRLDEAYMRMLGSGGDKLLGDEAKWLAITHKSFDHGRRGFNDRLAYLGRRIIDLQISHALIHSPQASTWPVDAAGLPKRDKFGRRPYTHAALDGLQGLTEQVMDAVRDRGRLAKIAEGYGLDRVTRWKPKKANDLQASGLESVLQTSLYAIVGAIALECGGEKANQVVQEKILIPLGFSFSTQQYGTAI